MTNKEQQELEKKALDQFMLGNSLFGKDGALAPVLKNFIEKESVMKGSNKNLKKINLEDNNGVSVEISKDFTDDYLDAEENPIFLLQPIIVTDLLFKIMTDLKGNMFRTSNKHLYVPKEIQNNQYKMNLWEKEVLNTGVLWGYAQKVVTSLKGKKIDVRW